MLPQQPVVFISKEFFISFCKLLQRVFHEIEIEEKKRLLFLEDLIFQRSTVFFDVSDEAIKNSNYADIVNYLRVAQIDEDEKIFLLYIDKIHKSRGVIRSCSSEMKEYLSFNAKAVRIHATKPHFILTSHQNNTAKEIQKQFGVICLSSDMQKLSKNICQLQITQIKSEGALNPSDYFFELPECNSIVIEEPYLLKQNYNYLRCLISSMLSKKLKILPATITLITKESEGNPHFIERLKEEFSGLVIIEHYRRIFTHDRNIFTNSFWVSSDVGFMEKYRNPTKWTSFPLGVYYSEYYERIKSTLTFLKNERAKSDNFLAKGFN